MASARRLYRLQLALAAAGIAAVGLALGVALTRVNFVMPSLDAVGKACRSTGLTDLSSASLAVLGLSSLAVAGVVLALRSMAAQRRAQRRFLRRLGELKPAEVAGGDVMITTDPRPQAFCMGLLRPRVFVSRGTVDLLGEEELRAVVAHEAHHAERRDPLRIFAARVLGDALFFLPAVRRLADRYAALAELAADEAAVSQNGDRRALAAALLVFDETPSATVVGIVPERVDHLLGTRARWELPLALMVGAAVTVAGLVAFAARTAEATGRASVDMPQLLAQACMVAMAAAPVLVAATVLLGAQRVLARGRG
jgi:beta-lactamase regulating signal transducer with metallopeptidase domain